MRDLERLVRGFSPITARNITINILGGFFSIWYAAQPLVVEGVTTAALPQACALARRTNPDENQDIGVT
jgi:hypothetical protein